MMLIRKISLIFSLLALILFVIVYFVTHGMQHAYYVTGSGACGVGEGVITTAVLGAILAIPGLFKKDRFSFVALLLSVFVLILLYVTGWHISMSGGA